jgi:hypothetical protein
MFERSACARVRVAADAHADLAALMALAELVRDALSDRFTPSNALLSGASCLSRDQNRGEVHATPGEANASAPPLAATNRPVRGRTKDDDRRHAGVVWAADRDTIRANRGRTRGDRTSGTDKPIRLIEPVQRETVWAEGHRKNERQPHAKSSCCATMQSDIEAEWPAMSRACGSRLAGLPNAWCSRWGTEGQGEWKLSARRSDK